MLTPAPGSPSDSATVLSATVNTPSDAFTMMSPATPPPHEGQTMMTPSGGGRAPDAPRRPGGDPTHIGPYRILQTLGEGGMGTVYLAEQERPLKRQVAIKVIKLGMDTREVVARFEAERQALARMDHPNIASVFDAGATDDGRPYFVMERVLGVPITEYCDEHRLSTRARLELFMDVCAAIQHAHQKAIIHRDIKPSNVLVSVQDDRPVPKVIDFGVAKATDQRLGDDQRTALGIFIGTPEYMSPEQAGITEADVDSRTDIYSLGVLLYELLVGAVPFESKRLRQTGYAEIQRIIREEEPARPSTRLTSLGATATELAGRRQTNAIGLGRDLRGDLDWITLKAIEKDRARRYQSASEFAADISRHLKNEPVVARPASVGYRARKFVARNRVGVAAAALVMLAVVGGLIASTILYFQAERERQNAEVQKTEADTRRAQADTERGRADAAKLDAEAQRGIARQEAASALEAGKVAVEQRAVAVQQRAAADEQRERADRRACVANVLAADQALRAGNKKEVRLRLDACPPALRGWEWAYLDRRIDSSDASFSATGAVQQLAFAPDGKRIQALIMTTGMAGRAFLVSRAIDADPFLPATRVSDGSEIALSPDGRLAVVSVWAAATVTRNGQSNSYVATDGKTPSSGPPADFLRLRDVTSKRDVATLSIPNPGRTAAVPDVWFRASHKTEGIPLAMIDAQRGLLGGASTVQSQMAAMGAGPSPPPAAPPGRQGGAAPPVAPPQPDPAALKAMMDKIAQDALKQQQQLLDALPTSDKKPMTVNGAFPYIVDAVFSPDGRRVAAWSWSNEIGVWDTSSGRPIATLTGHVDGVSSVAFSHDGVRLVSASYDGTLRVWDVAQQRTMATIQGHPGSIQAVAINADGSRIASGGADGSVRVWDSATMKAIWTRNDAGLTRAVAFSPDGRRVAAAGGDLTVHVWDTATGLGLARFYGHTQPINTVAFSPDGGTVASGGADQSIRLWRLGTAGLAVVGLHEASSTSGLLAWSGNSALVTASEDRTIHVWDAGAVVQRRSFQRPPVAPAPEDSLAAVIAAVRTFGGSAGAVARNGTRLVFAEADGTARVWSVFAGRVERTLPSVGGRTLTVLVSDDGARAFTSSTDGKTRVWDLGTGNATATGDFAFSSPAAITRDGRWLASASGTTGVVIRDTTTLQPVRTIGLQGRLVRALTFNPAGTEILIATSDLGSFNAVSMSIRDVATGRLLRTTLVETMTSVAYSPDGARIAASITAVGGIGIRIWDAHTLDTVLLISDDELVHARDEPVEKKVPPASAGDFMQKIAVLDPSAPPPTPDTIAFSADGLRLASTWSDGSVRVFDAVPKTAWQRARDLINGLNAVLPFASDVIERLNADTTLTPEVRSMAITFAKRREATPSALNSASWRVVKAPGAEPADYRTALRRVEEAASRLEGQTPQIQAQTLNTLAMAQFRVGQYPEALKTLAQLAARRPGDVNDSIVSVLVRLRLGQVDAARADLDKLLALKTPTADQRDLIAEAKALSDSMARRRR